MLSRSQSRGRAPDGGLPTNIDAEKFVLGSILLDDSLYIQAAGTLESEDFSIEKHRRIFRRMGELQQRGERIDRITVANELMKHSQLEACDGLSYLVSLDDGLPHLPNVESYIRIVKENSLLRHIMYEADAASKRAQSKEPVHELLPSIIEKFQRLQSENGYKPEIAPTVPSWPEPIHADGFHGVAGDLVRAIEPHTEADPAALLVQFLVAWGSLAARGPYYLAEDDRHHTNLYAVIVGTTSKGRKGTSWSRMKAVLATVDQHWVTNCLLYGIGSGEALIDALSNEDHRRLVVESEFARLLAIMTREGTTISSIFHQC
jgi:hypothetical protein